jgi:hypothetical protein
MKTTQRSFLYGLLFAASCAAYAACGGSNGGDTSTTGNPQPVGGTGGSTATGTGGSTATGGTGGATTTSGTGTGTGTGGAAGCFSGTPSTDDQYLNACNGLTCNPYPNDKAHLPLLNADGSLPPLP